MALFDDYVAVHTPKDPLAYLHEHNSYTHEDTSFPLIDKYYKYSLKDEVFNDGNIEPIFGYEMPRDEFVWKSYTKRKMNSRHHGSATTDDPHQGNMILLEDRTVEPEVSFVPRREFMNERKFAMHQTLYPDGIFNLPEECKPEPTIKETAKKFNLTKNYTDSFKEYGREFGSGTLNPQIQKSSNGVRKLQYEFHKYEDDLNLEKFSSQWPKKTIPTNDIEMDIVFKGNNHQFNDHVESGKINSKKLDTIHLRLYDSSGRIISYEFEIKNLLAQLSPTTLHTLLRKVIYNVKYEDNMKNINHKLLNLNVHEIQCKDYSFKDNHIINKLVAIIQNYIKQHRSQSDQYSPTSFPEQLNKAIDYLGKKYKLPNSILTQIKNESRNNALDKSFLKHPSSSKAPNNELTQSRGNRSDDSINNSLLLPVLDSKRRKENCSYKYVPLAEETSSNIVSEQRTAADLKRNTIYDKQTENIFS